MSIEKLTTINEIPVGGAIAVETGGTPIALVRPNASTVKAVHNCCSHQQYELAPEGWVGDNSIECALHGSTFDLDDGEPSSLPALDPIPVYACKLERGAVLVDIDQQLDDAPVPHH